MFQILKLRKRHGYQAIRNIRRATLPEIYRGFPTLDGTRNPTLWEKAAEECPVQAIYPATHTLDMGKCIFCGACERTSDGAIRFTNNYKLGSTQREKLFIHPAQTSEEYERQAIEVRREIRKIFGRSLKLRQVSAGGCNGCEMELQATANVNFDMGRFGIDFVASPRHADGIVISGPITKNMAPALRDAYNSVPSPKVVVLVGACAISGGLFADSDQLDRDLLKNVSVDLFVPGCPPHPLTFIHALLDFLGR